MESRLDQVIRVVEEVFGCRLNRQRNTTTSGLMICEMHM